jgi:DNA topoisomerase IB
MFYTLDLEVVDPTWVLFPADPGATPRDVAGQVRKDLRLPPNAEVFVASDHLKTWGYDAHGLTYYNLDLGAWGHDDAT